MLRAFGPRSGLALLLFSCAALAQSTAVPAEAPAPAPAHAVPAAGAPPLQACALKAFDDYAVAMSQWERQWAESVSDSKPEFAKASAARAAAHNSALQRDGYRIHFLAATAPDSLDLDESVAALRLFDWTPEQEQALRQAQPDYGAAADAAERDRQAAEAEPKSEALETYFEEAFTDNNGAIWARKLNEILGHGNTALEQCHRAFDAPAPKPAGPEAVPPPSAGATPGYRTLAAAFPPAAPRSKFHPFCPRLRGATACPRGCIFPGQEHLRRGHLPFVG